MTESFSISYETYGNSHHPCIILITGIGGQLIDWPSPLVEGLVDRGFYVVVFDNRDSGLSRHYDEMGIPNIKEAITAIQNGKDFHLPYTLEEMANDVITLMDKLHIEKVHILGASMGGIIAQYVALNYQNRVISLTCLSTTSGDPQLPSAKQAVLDFFATSLNSEDESLEIMINKKLQLFKIYNHPDYFDEEDVRNKLIKSFQRAHYPNGFKRLLLAMICAKPRTDRLKKLDITCLIIHGDYDPVFPVEHAKQLSECISGSYLEIIENMGHVLSDYFCKKVVNLITKYFKQLD